MTMLGHVAGNRDDTGSRLAREHTMPLYVAAGSYLNGLASGAPATGWMGFRKCNEADPASRE